MIVEVSISTPSVLRECIAQTSVDFTALRANNPQADGMCDDYTLSEDLQPEFMIQMETTATALYTQLSGCTVEYHTHGEHIGYRFLTCGMLDGRALHVLIKEYLKNGMLAWWYLGRSPELQLRYAESMAGLAREILAMIAPKYMNRKLRWF